MNPCRITAGRQHQGRDYSTRHHNLILRDERIALWKLEQRITCPDHPDRHPRVYTPQKEICCTAKTGTKTTTIAGPKGQRHHTAQAELPTFCTRRVAIPAEIR